MEAWRFGFDPSAPPACKFDPTDADVVAHYLLPRAAGVPDPPFAHAIIDDDTCSCPPWELLRRHGHGGSDHAFFVGPPSDPSVRGGRACRAVRDGEAPGGVWRGQKGVESNLLVARGGRGGAQLRLRCRRYYLSYYRRGDPSTSGWAMHEYHILHPKLLPGAVLSRIWITGRAKKEGKKQQLAAAAAAKKASPGPSSNYLFNDDDRASGNAAAAAATVASDGEGTSSGARSCVVHQEHGGSDGGVVGETGGRYYTSFVNAGEGDGCCADDSENYFNPGQPVPRNSYLVDDRAAGAGNAVALKNDDSGAGTSGGAQSDVVHQGGDVNGGGVVGETTGGYYTNFLNAGEGHECFVDDGNDYFK